MTTVTSTAIKAEKAAQELRARKYFDAHEKHLRVYARCGQPERSIDEFCDNQVSRYVRFRAWCQEWLPKIEAAIGDFDEVAAMYREQQRSVHHTLYTGEDYFSITIWNPPNPQRLARLFGGRWTREPNKSEPKYIDWLREIQTDFGLLKIDLHGAELAQQQFVTLSFGE